MKKVALNRQARHDYEISETLVAGLVLSGTEVKSIRNRRVSLKGSYCVFNKGELYLRGATISEYPSAGDNHDPQQDRKLLLTKKQLHQLRVATQQGFYIVPLAIGLKRSFIKLEIGVGKSLKKHDKRAKIRQQDDQRRVKSVTDLG